MLKGFELLMKRPNLGQPCLVKNESESSRISFDVIFAGKNENLDIGSHLEGKLFLQNLGDTREIWQKKFCRKITNKSEFLKNFDINNWPERIRNRLIPLEVVEWTTPSNSMWLADFHDPIFSCIFSLIPSINQGELFGYNMNLNLILAKNALLESGVLGWEVELKDSEDWFNLVRKFLKYNYIYKAKLSFDRRHLDKYQESLPLLFNLIQRDGIAYENLSREIFNIYFHSVYIHNNNWSSFRFIHATDAHVALRNDNFLREIVKRGAVMPSGGEDDLGYKKFDLKSRDAHDRDLTNWDENPNYNFRRFIEKSNLMHSKNLLNFIILTGDLTDFIYNDRYFSGDPWEPTDNFRLLSHLITGWPISEAFMAEEELEVPIFTTLGNHDYRFKEYPILGAAGMLWIDYFYKFIHYYEQFGLNYDEALAYMSQEAKSWTDYEGKTIPGFSADEGILFQRHLKEPPREYLNLINPDRDFIIELGDHKIVCMDSGPDERELEGIIDAIGYDKKIGTMDESRIDFAEHTPDSEGFSEEQIRFVEENARGSRGLIIFALHAPLVNYRETPPPRSFRETERKKAKKLTDKNYQDFAKDLTLPGAYLGAPVADPDGWSHSNEPYFKEGDRDSEKKCLIGCGVVDHQFDKFIEIIINKLGNRKAELIITGHIEKPIEYIVRIRGNTKEYYHDYYLDNKVFGVSPSLYWSNAGRETLNREMQTIEDYKDPLSNSKNPKEWWMEHSPLHVQNMGLGFPGLGPDRNPRNFPHQAGFLLIKVENDVIKSIEREYIVPSISNSLRDAGTRLGFNGQINGRCLAKELGYESSISIKGLIKEISLLPKGERR